MTVRSENGGVPSDDNSFLFRIIVTDENDVVIHNMSYSFSSNSEESLSIDLPVGEYSVSVISVNKYGTSDETIVGDVSVVLAPSPSVSPSSTDTIFGELNALECPLYFVNYLLCRYTTCYSYWSICWRNSSIFSDIVDDNIHCVLLLQAIKTQ